MKKLLLALAICSAPALAEQSKPVATQAGDALRPAAEAIGKGMNKLVNEFFAGSDGPMGNAARASLNAQDRRERESNRGARRSMKECIKPGNIIDDDVKECTEGLREKNW